MQLIVKLVGFAVAVPLAVAAVGGLNGLTSVAPPEPGYWTWWLAEFRDHVCRGAWACVFLSLGCCRRSFGARDDRAVRIGVGLNAPACFCLPEFRVCWNRRARPVSGTIGRASGSPMLLVHTLPPRWRLGLAAVFSAEISAADAKLFMLTTPSFAGPLQTVHGPRRQRSPRLDHCAMDKLKLCG